MLNSKEDEELMFIKAKIEDVYNQIEHINKIINNKYIKISRSTADFLYAILALTNKIYT